MLEFLFFLYLSSGFLKGVLLAYDVRMPVDLTLLLGVVVLLYSLFGKEPRTWSSRVFAGTKDGAVMIICFGAFLLWSLLSSIFISPSDGYAYWKCVALLTNILAIGVPLVQKRMNPDLLVRWLSGFAILYGLFSFFAYACRARGHLEIMGMARPEYLEGLYLQAGLLLGVTAILVLRLGKPYGVLLSNFMALLLLGTAARGPILFFFITLFVILGYHFYLVLHKKEDSFLNGSFKPSLRGWTLAILIGNLLLIGGVASSDLLSAPYKRTLVRYDILVKGEKEHVDKEQVGGVEMKGEDDGGKNKVQDKRLKEYRFAASSILSDPVKALVGHGFGSFNLLMYGRDGRGYPHNVILEILFELGLIGGVLSLFFFGSIFYRALKMGHVIFLFAVLFFMMNTMKSYSIVDLRLLFGLLGVAAFIPLSPSERGEVSR